jgi:hypothetical protein
MNTLIELIDLINKKGDVERKFFVFENFKKNNSLIFNYYTFDFDLIQKKDFEIKEIFKNFFKKNNFYKFIEEDFQTSKINILPSNVAEKIIEDYRNNLSENYREANSKLIDAYKARGFGNNYKL